jgi:hypothetical protein
VSCLSAWDRKGEGLDALFLGGGKCGDAIGTALEECLVCCGETVECRLKGGFVVDHGGVIGEIAKLDTVLAKGLFTA